MEPIKFVRDSIVSFEGKQYPIEVWETVKTGKLVLFNKNTGERITLDGRMGEEFVS